MRLLVCVVFEVGVVWSVQTVSIGGGDWCGSGVA